MAAHGSAARWAVDSDRAGTRGRLRWESGKEGNTGLVAVGANGHRSYSGDLVPRRPEAAYGDTEGPGEGKEVVENQRLTLSTMRWSGRPEEVEGQPE